MPTVEDPGDGTYLVKIACMIGATVKLVVNMDKDLPGTSGELAPLTLTFVHPTEPLHPTESRAVLGGPDTSSGGMAASEHGGAESREQLGTPQGTPATASTPRAAHGAAPPRK